MLKPFVVVYRWRFMRFVSQIVMWLFVAGALLSSSIYWCWMESHFSWQVQHLVMLERNIWRCWTITFRGRGNILWCWLRSRRDIWRCWSATFRGRGNIMVKLCEIAGGRNLECFPYKMHSKVRKKTANRRVRDDHFVLGSCSNQIVRHCIFMRFVSQIVIWLFRAGALYSWWCWSLTFRGRRNIWWCCRVTFRDMYLVLARQVSWQGQHWWFWNVTFRGRASHDLVTLQCDFSWDLCTWEHTTSHYITWEENRITSKWDHATWRHITSHDMTWHLATNHIIPKVTSPHNQPHYTASHLGANHIKSPRGHSISKFFLWLVVFSLWNFRPRLARLYLFFI